MRTRFSMSFSKIAQRVRNLKKRPSTKDVVRRVCEGFDVKAGFRKFAYQRCGRKPWKVTPELRSFLVRRLLALRSKCICTSTTLQRECAKEMKLKVATSTIRKIVFKAGYQWMRRAQKPKLSKELMERRVVWSRRLLNMSDEEYNKFFSLMIDGVVVSCPPKDAVDRANFCTVGDTHMYRKPSEAAKADLAGDTQYGKQVPLSRAVPFWGGINRHGFSVIAFHPTKKIQPDEWAKAVRMGKLKRAIVAGGPLRQRGPFRVLADNEGFLNDGDCRAAHRAENVKMFHIPPRSPDLNPIEKFWSWMRRQLRKKDLADLVAGRAPLGKMAYRKRIVNTCRSQKAKRAAANISNGLRKVCKEVVAKKGARSRG